MMKVEQIKTPDDIERYIEGFLNDFETAISTKEETVVFLAELVVHIYKEAKKEQCNIADVVSSLPSKDEKLIGNMCLSFRHDFSLLPKLIQDDLKRDCKNWLIAYENNRS